MSISVKSCCGFDLKIGGLIIGYCELVAYIIVSIVLFYNLNDPFRIEFSMAFAGKYFSHSLL